MKKFLRLIFPAAAALILAACDHGFEDMNVNPNASTEVTPGYLFTNAQLDAVSVNYVGGAYLTIGGSMQHFATYKEVPAAGDKYFNYSYSTGNWNAYAGVDLLGTTGAVIDIQQVIDAVSELPADVNKLAVARIWRVYIFHRLTDLYGDIPYSDAGKALTEKNYAPKYDEQSAIYADMFKELEESVAMFDASQATFATADLIYGGDITKWKKFAYSLMLRLGMRLASRPATVSMAQTWVEKAIAGGVLTEDADIATIGYVDGSITSSRNFIASGLLSNDYITPGGDNVEGGKFAKTLIDHLKITHDPRLNVIAIVWVPNGTSFVADTATALQKGMPNAAFNSFPADFNSYSEPNPNTILKYSAPLLVFTPAEVNLLLAEAAARGWYSGATAEALYNKAVTSAMKQWSLFGSAGIIADSRIASYLAQNPYNAAGSLEEQIAQLQTQKWVSLVFEDEYEIFSSWRRTGYPALTPTNYPGNLTGGQIPRRFVIPDSEGIYNATHFIEARDRQDGTNALSSQVWWDKP